jgi:S1-C subfamily serine protease
LPAFVVAKREFAGSWEYLLDEAIFTAPQHESWSGAALIGRDGRLLGVGSLALSDVSGKGEGESGNMFVPIDRLAPVFADLVASGRPAVAHPWLGLSTEDTDGRLVVSRVTPGAPAEKAGVRKGDIIVGVNGETPKDLPDFYRKVWSLGPAGADILLDVLQNHRQRTLLIHSMNRLDHLKLNSSF